MTLNNVVMFNFYRIPPKARNIRHAEGQGGGSGLHRGPAKGHVPRAIVPRALLAVPLRGPGRTCSRLGAAVWHVSQEGSNEGREMGRAGGKRLCVRLS